jgi:DNA-binding NarL/FixJ family response regulator
MQFLVVDDHALIREAMIGDLRELSPECVIIEAQDARSALALLAKHAGLDLVLLDLNLPDQPGLDVLESIVRLYPTTAVVVLSAERDRGTIRRALDGGAQGFIPKAETRSVLVQALALILAGGTYVPKAALGGTGEPEPSPRALSDGPTPESLGLTDRQIDVLALLMEGKNNKLICRGLGLAEPTVKNHVSAILKALGATSRTEAVLAVTKLGWTFPRPRSEP